MWEGLRHPSKSMLFVSHTAAMADKVYKDILLYLNDEKREIKAIFPEFDIKEQNAEQHYIQLKHSDSNPYHTFYFRGIDGNMAGVLEASWLLYCDDLIKNIEEAMNPDRLETARTKYGVDIRQRKSNKKVRELHIATRWSVYDVISTLENEYGDNDRWKFIKRPALDENGKSNFMYEGDYALDEDYFLQQRNSPMMDEVSFSCIYQQEPIEREGLLFNEHDLKYYDGTLPEIEPDLICGAVDIAWGGGDFTVMPIAKVYGTAVYITDVVFNDKTKEITRPIVAGKIMNNNMSRVFFEANNGGELYAEDIKEFLQKHNYKCFIDSGKQPTNKTKLARILACVDEIKGVSTEYQLIFLDKEHRSPEYEGFMKQLFKFNQSAKYIGKQHDDVPDALASLVSNVLEVKISKSVALSNFSRRDMDF